jgi:hypothetical protein
VAEPENQNESKYVYETSAGMAGAVFAAIATAVCWVLWTLSNCSSLTRSGGDTCMMSHGLAPYVLTPIFLVVWLVASALVDKLPDWIVKISRARVLRKDRHINH